MAEDDTDMTKNGSLGSFGKAAPTKIANPKKLGGKAPSNLKRIAAKRRRKRGAKSI